MLLNATFANLHSLQDLLSVFSDLTLTLDALQNAALWCTDSSMASTCLFSKNTPWLGIYFPHKFLINFLLTFITLGTKDMDVLRDTR